MTNEEAKEVFRMIRVSVYKRFSWLQDADRHDLEGYVWEQVNKFHKPTEKRVIPNYRFCDCFVKSQAIKKGYIKAPHRSNGGNTADDGTTTYIFGMTTDRAVVSIDELFEVNGWETSVPCIETMIIERSERTVYERMVQCYLDNPWQSVKIKLAIKHIANGGDMKNFAISVGMSGQTLKNVIRREVHRVNHDLQQCLPLN